MDKVLLDQPEAKAHAAARFIHAKALPGYTYKSTWSIQYDTLGYSLDGKLAFTMDKT